jgi:hypothetical protein
MRSFFLEKDTAERVEAVEQLRDRSEKFTSDVAMDGATRRVVGVPEVRGTPVLMTSDVFADVEMFECHESTVPENKEGPEKKDKTEYDTVFNSINRAHTRGSAAFLRTLISVPVREQATLQARRDLVRRMRARMERPPAEQPLAFKDPEDMRRCEEDVMWAYLDKDDSSTSSLFDVVYFNTWLTRSLNKCPMALSCLNIYRIAVSPLIGLLAPILYFVLPYLILRYKAQDIRAVAREMGIDADIPQSFAQYLRHVYGSFIASDAFMSAVPSSFQWVKYVSCGLSLVFYFQAVFNSFEISRTLRIVSAALNERMTKVWRFFARASYVVKAYWDDDMNSAFFADLQSVDELEDTTSLFSPEDEMGSSDFSRRGFAGLHIGEGLSRYKMFDHERFARLLRTYYAVDAVLAICRLLIEGEQEGRFSIVQAAPLPPSLPLLPSSSSTHPSVLTASVRFLGAWHPCIERDVAVRNDVEIDRSREDAPNMLITGPNAGGKSTLIKSIVICALLSQSITVCPCSPGSHCSAFGFINSQINVPDVKGKRSLFEEEMFRSRSNLDAVRGLGGKEAALVVIDEIFSSTNPVEGISGAYAVSKHLGRLENCATVISTHYAYLCRLSRERYDDESSTRQPQQRRMYKNYQMPVVESAPGSVPPFTFPYRLTKGVCRQYIALELLKTHGFDADVINDAIDVKRSISSA